MRDFGFIQQTTIKNGDAIIQRTVIQSGPNQAYGANIFNGYQNNSHVNNDFNANGYGEPLFNNCCECENEGGNENYDFDNSDIERILNGSLGSNYNNSSNNESSKTYIIYTDGNASTQPNKNDVCVDQNKDELSTKIASLEKELASLKERKNSVTKNKEENDFVPNTKKDRDDFEARMAQLKEDQKEAARRGFIGTPDKPEKKENPSPIAKPVAKKPVSIDISNMAKSHQPPVKQKAISCLSFTYPQKTASNNWDTIKSHKSPSAKPVYSAPISTINCHPAPSSKPIFPDTIKSH